MRRRYENLLLRAFQYDLDDLHQKCIPSHCMPTRAIRHALSMSLHVDEISAKAAMHLF